MALYKSSNPALGKETFRKAERMVDDSSVMTIQGTVNKLAMLGLLLMTTATLIWNLMAKGTIGFTGPLVYGSIFGGLILAVIIVFKPKLAPTLAPIYALVEGVVVGGISYLYGYMYDGIVMQALFLTLGVFFAMLMIYKSGLIKVTENFKLMVAAATGGIMIYYLVSLVMGMFGGGSLPLIHESSLMGIGFSLFVIAIASLNLVVDFDFIEAGAEQGAPKYMEWYGAFGLLVTLIWLYIEILRLLAKLQSRD